MVSPNVLPVLLDLLFSVTTTVFAVAQPLEDDNKHPRVITYFRKDLKIAAFSFNCWFLVWRV